MKCKKLISVFACSFLLLGGGTLLAVQSASKNAARLVRADDTDLGRMYFTRVMSGDSNQITLGTPCENVIDYSDWPAFDFVDGSIDLNGVDVSAGRKFQKCNTHEYYFPINDLTLTDGDTLTIEGSFRHTSGSDSYYFNVQQTRLKWTGTEWQLIPFEVGTVEYESVHGASTNRALYLRGSDTYSVMPQSWSLDFSVYYPVEDSGYVTLNGVELDNARLRKVPEIEPGYYWYLELDADNAVAADEGDVVEIGGNWSGSGFNFTVSTFHREWNGNLWGDVNIDVGEISFTGVRTQASTSTNVYLYAAADNVMPMTWDVGYTPDDLDSGIFVNGNRLESSEIKKVDIGVVIEGVTTPIYWFHVEGIEEGSVVEVKGDWTGQDGCDIYHFSVASFKKEWDGAAWGPVNVTVPQLELYRVESGTSAYIILNSTETNEIPTSWDTAYTPAAGSIFLNNTDVSATAVCKKPGGQGYFFEGFGGAQEGDVLTIKGTWSGQSGDTVYHFSFAEIKKEWNGTEWGLVNITADPVNLNGLSDDGPSNDHQLSLYGTSTSDVPTSWDTAYTVESGDVRKNGVPLDGVVCKKIGAQGYFFEGFTVTQNDIIKIDATFVGEVGEYRYHFHLNEYSIQYKGDGIWGLVDVNLGQIEFTQALAASTSSAVYFYTESENLIPADWAHIYPDGAEQVLFNGEDITENRTLQKSNDHDYYMGLGRTAIAGDLLEISGSWTIDIGQYSYHFTVKDLALRFSGEVWQNLAQYKESCKASLDTYLSEDNYLPADWDNIEQWIVNGKDNIDVCVSFDDVDQMVDTIHTNLNSVPTKADRQQELEEAKAAGKAEIADYKADVEYREEQEAQRANIVSYYQSLIDNINQYSGIGQIAVEVETAKEAIDALPTKADLDLQDAKDAAYAQLDAIDPQDYYQEQRQRVNSIINQAREDIEAATSEESVNTILTTALAQIAEIPTGAQVRAAQVDALIDEIGEVEPTEACYNKIMTAIQAYQQLDDAAKAYVTKLDVLQAAAARYNVLYHAASAEYLISLIPEEITPTQACFNAIGQAYSYCYQLTDEELDLVSNLDVLFDAMDEYEEVLDAAIEAAKARVMEFYDSINMKKYSKDNQELIDQLTADVIDALEALYYGDNIDAMITQYMADVNEVPQKKAPAKKGCGGSVIATSIVLSTLALAGLGLAISKKREEE